MEMFTALEALAGAGALVSMVSNIPQVWKVRHHNSTSDLHVCTVFMHCISAALWSAYGFMLELYILGIESGIVTLLNILILLAIYRDSRSSSNTKRVHESQIQHF